jgi:hypothetical protein
MNHELEQVRCYGAWETWHCRQNRGSWPAEVHRQDESNVRYTMQLKYTNVRRRYIATAWMSKEVNANWTHSLWSGSLLTWFVKNHPLQAKVPLQKSDLNKSKRMADKWASYLQEIYSFIIMRILCSASLYVLWQMTACFRWVSRHIMTLSRWPNINELRTSPTARWPGR